MRIARKKLKFRQLKDDENGLLNSFFKFHLSDCFVDFFIFSLKRKENLKTKKYTDIQNSNKTNESTSSSSDEGCEESVKSKTNKSDSPLAITEEDQLDKEPLSSLSAVQQHQKTDIRNHLRYRQQINSSDEEVDEKEISS